MAGPAGPPIFGPKAYGWAWGTVVSLRCDQGQW